MECGEADGQDKLDGRDGSEDAAYHCINNCVTLLFF